MCVCVCVCVCVWEQAAMASWDKALATLTHVDEYLDGEDVEAVLAGIQALLRSKFRKVLLW